MNEPNDFVKALLAQESLFDSPGFARHRENLLERIAQAEQRERRARWITVSVGVGVVLICTALFAAATNAMGNQVTWPDWALWLAALTMLLSPTGAVLLLVLYFVRPRRELHRIRERVHQEALLEMPRQIAELKRRIEEQDAKLSPNNPPAAPPGTAGFTLIEMLVTVAIMGLLAALLLPALAGAKSLARGLACRSNLAQMAKALAAYDSEYRYYPGAGDAATVTNQVTSVAPDSWRARLLPFLGNQAAVLRCPDHRPFSYGAVASESYGYNATGTSPVGTLASPLGLGDGKEWFVGSTQVKSPSGMIALGDLDLPPGVAINTLSPNLPAPMGGVQSLISGRHQAGAQMACCDGHVEWGRQPRWVEKTVASRSRWNLDAEAHPETW